MEDMQIKVKMLDGRQIEVTVPSGGRIADISERVLEAEDAPIHKMIRLIYGGRVMQPADSIAEYGLGPDVVIHAVISDAPGHVSPRAAAPSQPAAHTSWSQLAAVHAQAERQPRRSAGSRWPADEDQLEGLLLKLPPAIILALLWYVFLTRGGDLFSWFSTGSLLVLTVLYFYYALPGALNGPVSTLQHALTQIYSYTAPAPPPDPRHPMEAIDLDHLHQEV